MKNIVITGAAGFIGSHLAKRFVKSYPEYMVIALDALTYAGNLENLKEIEHCDNFCFEEIDINDLKALSGFFEKYQVQHIIHLAAESHVDRSIDGPMSFVQTNVVGTVNLLEQARKHWQSNLNNHIFYHVSTDEVFGSLGETGFFTESTPYDPRSPYSASKAASDHFVNAYHHTYGIQVKRSNCSNNYGSFHHPEKLIPLVISNILENKPLPIYGNGQQIRDWLWVEDHAAAIDCIFHNGAVGCNYNVGGWNEWKNLDLVELICDTMDEMLDRTPGTAKELISFVKDRAGHDQRYAIDATKLFNELGWKPSLQFDEGIRKTIQWYLNNEDWVRRVKSGEYTSYYIKKYGI